MTDLGWPPTQTPERAAYIRSAFLSSLAALLDGLMADLADSAGSTEGLSLTDRTMVRIVRPYVPRMRALVLARLASVDPAVLERTGGALATAVEQVLAEAPGESLDRWRLVWLDGAERPELVPDVWSDRRGVDTDPEELAVSTPAAAADG